MTADWRKPGVAVEVLGDRSSVVPEREGFLRVRRYELRNRYDDGASSAPYRYDVIERRATDAVVIVLFARRPDDGLDVCLRSSLRPPLAFRAGYAVPVDADDGPVLWELPAGLVEPDERGEAGLRACAARETREETGFEVAAEAFERIGPSVYLSPGTLAEKLHYLVAEVDPATRGVPTEDGSPVEARAFVRMVPLAEALEACDDGRIADAKTEGGLRRLASGRGMP